MQTFAEAERHHWKSMETEWDKEKQKILNSLLGSNHELEFPAEADVRRFGKVRGGVRRRRKQGLGGRMQKGSVWRQHK